MASEPWEMTDEELAGLTDAELVELDRRVREQGCQLEMSLGAEQLFEWFCSVRDPLTSWLDVSGPEPRPALEAVLADCRDRPLTDLETDTAKSWLMSLRLEREKGERVRIMLQAARVALGLTHQDIATVTGLEPELMAEIEQGRAWSPRPDLFEQSCTLEGLKEARHLSRTPWLPLAETRFCRTIREVEIDPAWLTNADGNALSLARSIREGRSFDRLPELGEVLEKAGCAEVSILDHCRDPGLHAAGCWVVDAMVRAGRRV
jgi:transcriptional regulator with XRE-family HTH domain